MALALLAHISLKASSSAFSVNTNLGVGTCLTSDETSVLASSPVGCEAAAALDGATADAIFSCFVAGGEVSASDITGVGRKTWKSTPLMAEHGNCNGDQGTDDGE